MSEIIAYIRSHKNINNLVVDWQIMIKIHLLEFSIKN